MADQGFHAGNGRVGGIVPHDNRLSFGDAVEKTVCHFNFSREGCERSVGSRRLARLELVGDVTETSSVPLIGLLLRDGRLRAASAFPQAPSRLRCVQP